MGKLKQNNSVYQAELTAIKEACQWASTIKDAVKVWSDSESSLHSILALNTNSPIAQEIQNTLINSTNIKLGWVKAHANNLGNETADQLAKRATIEGTTIDIPLPKSALKKQLHSVFLKKWQEEWDSGQTGRSTYTVLPKVPAGARGYPLTSDLNSFLPPKHQAQKVIANLLISIPCHPPPLPPYRYPGPLQSLPRQFLAPISRPPSQKTKTLSATIQRPHSHSHWQQEQPPHQVNPSSTIAPSSNNQLHSPFQSPQRPHGQNPKPSSLSQTSPKSSNPAAFQSSPIAAAAEQPPLQTNSPPFDRTGIIARQPP
ncbi:hypothetical protein HNY73_011537 [Argiope bruennichi]|uniref:RNase H type-1 domain-containing protein n=1 Tax=Argiope bruennichi TaxID=94029 RepID=A0A8T0F1L7_ARGBR|nr:hypothetical protein HNY73_011537 [Argiope bruennichi]